MGKTVACIIARNVSTRLPGKVFKKVTQNLGMLEFIIARMRLASLVDEVYVCTSVTAEDDVFEDLAEKAGVGIYRGSPDEVIERMVEVGKISNADNLIRITGDNVFTSYEYLDSQIGFLERNGLDYVRLVGVPVGATAEVMARSALEDCYDHMDRSVSEYLMLFIFDPFRYRCGVIRPFAEDHSGLTLTVDTTRDLERTLKITSLAGDHPLDLKLAEIIELIRTNDIPYSHFESGDTIKMPYGKTVSVLEFKKDMDSRISRSMKLNMY